VAGQTAPRRRRLGLARPNGASLVGHPARSLHRGARRSAISAFQTPSMAIGRTESRHVPAHSAPQAGGAAGSGGRRGKESTLTRDAMR
jgi:hypothetical protein